MTAVQGPTPDRNSELVDIEYELTLLSRYHALAQRAELHLDRSAYLLLGRLELDHPKSLKELSCAFSLDISTINRQIGALRRQGLVERVEDPEGGLARKFQPTIAGLSKLRADREHSIVGVGRVLGDWSPDSRRALSELLRQFNQSVEKLEGRDWPRPISADQV
ncbi:MarR family winged helix-turn-helix transcriptional regulator [Rhodococcus sp. IEGM 1379]|uniref:MarR family winged helix-turn-helix transcriptional regulator n=1 Tax=Rhodococcus sp. IEGM 1379 TaxID=3047086 RepID=UPI0024B7F84A|nr:MarR family winged helix-turn-helix transcriptional regulator [Rhodococcus sp. IEGM 1379]MDI9917346.1 MarR family winged helix-turn-helix transcriptional regulator [Rhodococcus sp. IEGM 1379]